MLSGDKGWSLEYIRQLTYRQIQVLWERYWHRKTYDLNLMIKTNPFSTGKKSDAPPGAIDATSDEGWNELKELGLPIKTMKG